MPSDQFTRFMNDLNRLIMELVNSPQNEEKMGGIMVIGALLCAHTQSLPSPAGSRV